MAQKTSKFLKILFWTWLDADFDLFVNILSIFQPVEFDGLRNTHE